MTPAPGPGRGRRRQGRPAAGWTLTGGEGFLHVQLRPALGCFLRHVVGPDVGPPSHGALGHVDGGGAAAGREQRRDGQASGEAWEEKTLVFVDE